jgi:hypothetical protein
MSALYRSRAIAAEVASYRPDYSEIRDDIEATLVAPLDDIEHAVGHLSITKRREVISGYVGDALAHSREVVRQAQSPIKPNGAVSRLTQWTLGLTVHAGILDQLASDKPSNGCCIASELMFVDELARLRNREPLRSSYRAGVVLLDAEDELCAYQKTGGRPYAYVWRDSQMRTRAGLRQVPAGAIMRPIYGRNSNGRSSPYEMYADRKLIGVPDYYLDDILFVRLGMGAFPRDVHKAALLEASSPGECYYSEYRHRVAEAVTTDNAAFADQISALMNKGAINWIE